MVTNESAAWAVTWVAGATIGVILGHGVTARAIAAVASVAAIAFVLCTWLLRASHRRAARGLATHSR